MARTVTLSPDEVHLGATHGVLRRFQHFNMHRRDYSVIARNDWDNDIEGALAELAFCKARSQYWSGLGGVRAKDGGNVEIRWTKHFGTGGLLLYDGDDDDSLFVLMEGFAPTYSIVGWMLARDGKAIAERKPFGLLIARTLLKGYRSG